MNDDQWAVMRLRELLERARKAVLLEYGRRARELGLPWR